MKRLITIVVFIACAVVVSSSLYDYNSTDQERGPAHWFALTEIANNTCGGERQSPIDIETRLAGTSGCDIYGDYKFFVSSAHTRERGNVLQPVTHNCHFKKSKLIWPPNAQKGDCTFGDAEFEVSDHNVEVSFSNANCTKDKLILPDLPDEVFELVQAHIHSGTEHTFDGSYNAAELHMVHESTNNTGLLAVIGIIFQVGAPEEQPFFRTLLDEWISIDQDRKDHCTEQQRNLDNNSNLRHRQLLEASDTPLYIYDIIPANESFYRYEGGLTTPPCTEIVHWSVASRPLEISTTEERDLAELILGYVSDDCAAGTVASTGGGTNRPTQPLNGRTVELLCPASFQPTGVDSGTFSNSMTLTMVLLVLSLWLHY